MNIDAVIGANIRRIRKEQGLTIEDLAFYAETTSSHLGRIERGKTNPTVKTLQRIAKALGVETADFFVPIREPKIVVTK